MASHPRRHRPSATRSLSDFELEQLRVTALGLPSSWCAVLDTVYGQLALTPARGYHWRTTDVVASPTGRVDKVNPARRRP